MIFELIRLTILKVSDRHSNCQKVGHGKYFSWILDLCLLLGYVFGAGIFLAGELLGAFGRRAR